MMAGETPMDDSERLSDLLLDAEEIQKLIRSELLFLGA